MARVMQYANPSRQLLAQIIIDTLKKPMMAARYSYVIRNHLALEAICNVTTAQVYKALQQLEHDGHLKRRDTGRGRGSPYRFLWSLTGEEHG